MNGAHNPYAFPVSSYRDTVRTAALGRASDYLGGHQPGYSGNMPAPAMSNGSYGVASNGLGMNTNGLAKQQGSGQPRPFTDFSSIDDPLFLAGGDQSTKTGNSYVQSYRANDAHPHEAPPQTLHRHPQQAHPQDYKGNFMGGAQADTMPSIQDLLNTPVHSPMASPRRQYQSIAISNPAYANVPATRPPKRTKVEALPQSTPQYSPRSGSSLPMSETKPSMQTSVRTVPKDDSESHEDGPRKYVCPHPSCYRAFSRRYNLETHLNTHDPARNKPYICNHERCNKRFGRKHDLQRHVHSVHENNRSFACKACSRVFSRKDTLRRHEEDGCPNRPVDGRAMAQAAAEIVRNHDRDRRYNGNSEAPASHHTKRNIVPSQQPDAHLAQSADAQSPFPGSTGVQTGNAPNGANPPNQNPGNLYPTFDVNGAADKYPMTLPSQFGPQSFEMPQYYPPPNAETQYGT